MTDHADSADDETHTPTDGSDAPDDAGSPQRGARFHLLNGAEGAITGTVVCAAVIAYGADHFETAAQLTVAILGTVIVYWLAHLHAETIGASLTHGHRPLVALRHAFVETVSLLVVSTVPLVVLLVATMLGKDLQEAAWPALIATIALLAVYSYVAGARSGLDTGGRLASAAAGAAVGVLVAVLKVALH